MSSDHAPSPFNDYRSPYDLPPFKDGPQKDAPSPYSSIFPATADPVPALPPEIEFPDLAEAMFRVYAGHVAHSKEVLDKLRGCDLPAPIADQLRLLAHIHRETLTTIEQIFASAPKP